MNQKQLGRCGYTVSEVGFGARWLAAKGQTEEQRKNAVETLRLALSSGITLIDTAAGYGDSETVLGETLKAAGVKVTLSSKCWSGDERKIRESLEKSLRRLNVPAMDIYFIHNPEDTFTALPYYQKLKEEGLIRAIGVCGWHGDEELMRRAVEDGRPDLLQVAASLAHRGMLEKGVIWDAFKRNLGVLVMSPLSKGVLTGPSPAISPLKEYGIRTLEQASLKFLMDHLPTGIPIPGTSKPEHLREYLLAADLKTIPENIWQAVIKQVDATPELKKLP